jgi:hypothetical protein
MNDRPNIECEWSAWYNRMPGRNDPDLHVNAHCKLPSGSIQVRLEPGNEGIVDDPKVFVLQATVDVPDIGTDDYVERDFPWQEDVGQDIEEVRVQGDLNATVKVGTAS